MTKKVEIMDSPESIDKMIGFLETVRSSFPQAKVLEVEVRDHKTNRSLSQNRLYWRWAREIADHIESTMGEIHSDEAIHALLKQTFLPMRCATIRGEAVRERKSTAKLNTKEMAEYMEKVDQWASRDLGLVLSHPEDLYYQAMGAKR